jgi:hypothetical protein
MGVLTAESVSRRSAITMIGPHPELSLQSMIEGGPVASFWS